tara:strand:+ start:126 stop:1646 length:1521 start_codon:yes stop_codon:yes gene_type:complete
MTTIESTNQYMYQTISDDASITVIEKQFGRTTAQDITEALDEYKRLFKAGIASDAEILTLSRAYPKDPIYQKAAKDIDSEPVVVGGPASVELIDREGHLITTDALTKAFDKYMSNFRTRNTMVLHSDVQVGWALPAYISKTGQVFKSGVDEKGLFFVTEIRKDTKIANRVLEQINEGKLKSYSIAGSATKTQNLQKGLMPYMQVDEMELAEITVCEKGVNQAAGFDILKGHDAATTTCTDGSCLIHLEKEDIEPHNPIDLIYKENGDINFFESFQNWVEKEDIVTSGKTFPTLHNFAGRDAEHHQLLREQGFPSEQPQAAMRYTPVVETAADAEGIPLKNKPPWYVNEAGEHLGEYLDDSAPTFKKAEPKEDKGTEDQTEEDSNDAFELLEESPTDLVKDSDKPEDNLIGWTEEFKTEQLELDTDIVSADSDVPSTPSMGWFDMLKSLPNDMDSVVDWVHNLIDEIKVEAVTEYAMDKAYPDWKQDKEAFSEHLTEMRTKIKEGYK